jgi:hypothetical protein
VVPPISSTNKTYHNDIAEILLKVAPNTIKQTMEKPFFVLSKKIKELKKKKKGKIIKSTSATYL